MQEAYVFLGVSFITAVVALAAPRGKVAQAQVLPERPSPTLKAETTSSRALPTVTPTEKGLSCVPDKPSQACIFSDDDSFCVEAFRVLPDGRGGAILALDVNGTTSNVLRHASTYFVSSPKSVEGEWNGGRYSLHARPVDGEPGVYEGRFPVMTEEDVYFDFTCEAR